MNVNTFFERFDRFADAPDAPARIRAIGSPFQGSRPGGIEASPASFPIPRALPWAPLGCPFGAPELAGDVPLSLVSSNASGDRCTGKVAGLGKTKTGALRSAEGAAYVSPGQRPGLECRPTPQALKGRPNA